MSFSKRTWCSKRLELSRHLRQTISLAASQRSNIPIHQSFIHSLPSQQHSKPCNIRTIHTSPHASSSPTPKSRDRGPVSKETTQTDFGKMDVLGNIPPPASAVDSCLNDGFTLSNGLTVKGAGVLLVGGEVFRWTPWISGSKRISLSASGLFQLPEASLGILDLLWPKPDLIVVGTGPSVQALSPATRKLFSDMGIRVEVSDTRNASAQYNLLATERGIHEVGALLIPLAWKV